MVNDQPSFSASNPSTLEVATSTVVTLPQWVTGFNPSGPVGGPTDTNEALQTVLNYIVSGLSDPLALLSAGPTVVPGTAAVTEFNAGITAASAPIDITTGPDGNLWFTESGASQIGRITPTGVITEFATGISPGAGPSGIVTGPDGNLWFTENLIDRIGRITPTGTVTEFSVGITPGSGLREITVGQDGNLWFTENSGNRIGRITTAGTVTEFSVTGGSGPIGIAPGSDGNLWFTENSGNRIGRITTAGTVTEFSAGITAGSGPWGIVSGADGNLWFTENSGNRIGRITTAGTVTEFSAGITAGSGPTGITTGPDGNLWFTENSGNQIGRITTLGVITEYGAGITPSSGPLGITTGPDGNLWFAENVGNRIGQLKPPGLGDLQFTLNPNVSGTATFVLQVQDNGGTANGGIDTSVAQTFTLTVGFVNHPPNFTAAPTTISVAEDSAAQTVANFATYIPGAGNDPREGILHYNVTGVTPGLFTVPPAVSNTGTLTYTPAANASGQAVFTLTAQDLGGTTGGGSDTSAAQVFTINVTFINDQPSFTAGNVLVQENSATTTVPNWVTAFFPSGGPVTDPNEVGQTVVGYTVTIVSNPSVLVGGVATPLLSGTPTVTPNLPGNLGTLQFTVNNSVSGTATFAVTVQDSGGAQGGLGVDTSVSQTFTITVSFVNQPPSFTKGPDPIINEDSGLINLPNWATKISPDQNFPAAANEQAQTVNFIVVGTSAPPGTFLVAPSITPAGALSFRLAPDALGPAVVTIELKDNGGTASGGQDTSAVQTFTISGLFVNDVPTFNKGPDVTVLENSGPRTVTSWATNVSADDVFPTSADETGQTINFNFVTNSFSGLFSAGPSIDTAGNLTFTPAANVSGSAVLTFNLHDNAGTANGGVDTSPTKTFTINVTFVNQPPSFTATNPPAVPEDTAGANTVSPWATYVPGPGNVAAGESLLQYHVIGVGNTALFTAGGQPVVNGAGNLTYTLAPNQSGTATFTVTSQNNGGTANGGNDTSAPQTFTIIAALVNDQPSFTASSPAAVNEDTGAHTLAGWVTAFEPSGTLPSDANEAGQTVLAYNVSGVSNTALFTVAGQPAVDTTGKLTYTLAPNQSGSSTFTVAVQDSGGTALGGIDTSVTQTFTLNVAFINDQPSFTAVDPPTVNEDTGLHTLAGWVSAFEASGTLPTDTNELSQSVLAYHILGVGNTALFTVGGQPSVSNGGTLTYTLAPNQNGSSTFTVTVQDSGGTTNGGVDTSVAQTFTLTVNLVNDQPSFTAVNPPAVNEDTGAHTVPGWVSAFEPSGTLPTDSNEVGQSALAYNVSGVTNTALFTVGGQPVVSSTGTLTYTLAANQSGTSLFTVAVQDSGGTANGGVDTSASQTFTLTANLVNDQPSFTAVSPATVNEDTGANTVPGWVSAFEPSGTLPTDGNELSQTVLAYHTTGVGNTALFTAGGQPAISPAGVLTYTLAPNQSGSSTFTVTVQDSGGTSFGGVDTSVAQTFTLNVNFVNDQPSFTAVNPPAANEDTGAHTVPGWVSAFEPSGTLPTDGNEVGQSALGYTVSGVSNTALFTAGGQPVVSSTGTLTYTLAANQSGSSLFTVTVQDSGGTANGGIDTSAAQTFTLTANLVNDQPSFTAVSPATVNEDTGAHTVGGWVSAFEPSGTLPTDGNELSQTVLAYHTTGVGNTALFTAGGQPAVNSAGTLTYTLAPNQSGSSTFTVTVQDSGGTSFGGVDTSVAQTFTLNVNFVNDQPGFTAVNPAAVNEDTGAHTVPGWVSAFEPSGTLPTDGNEVGQSVLAYTVSGVSNTALFTAGGQPVVSTTGTLTYTLAANQSGTFAVHGDGAGFGRHGQRRRRYFRGADFYPDGQPGQRPAELHGGQPGDSQRGYRREYDSRLGERLRTQRHLAHRWQ